jgi:hypothetical protein
VIDDAKGHRYIMQKTRLTNGPYLWAVITLNA